MYAIRSYYDHGYTIVESSLDKNRMVVSHKNMNDNTVEGIRYLDAVITSYSIHYTKLYETGWRLGYACGHPAIIDAMKKIHQYAIMCAPTTAQYAAIEALKSCDEEVSNMVKEYNRRRRVLVDALNKMGLDCFEPKGAFYVFRNNFV